MAQKLSGKKVAVLGAGKLGGILLQSLLNAGMFSRANTRATVLHDRNRAQL